MYQLKATKTVSNIWSIFRAGLTSENKTAVSTQQAVRTAFQEFQKLYPSWTDSLFDERFLYREAAPLFANGKLPNSRQLANAWRGQFNVGTPAQKAADVQKMQPVAGLFLQMVRQELYR